MAGVCKFFLEGRCKKGKRCTFKHVQNRNNMPNNNGPGSGGNRGNNFNNGFQNNNNSRNGFQNNNNNRNTFQNNRGGGNGFQNNSTSMQGFQNNNNNKSWGMFQNNNNNNGFNNNNNNNTNTRNNFNTSKNNRKGKNRNKNKGHQKMMSTNNGGQFSLFGNNNNNNNNMNMGMGMGNNYSGFNNMGNVKNGYGNDMDCSMRMRHNGKCKCSEKKKCKIESQKDFQMDIWPLSCYAHSESMPSCIHEDYSFEEIRMQLYETKNMDMHRELFSSLQKKFQTSKENVLKGHISVLFGTDNSNEGMNGNNNMQMQPFGNGMMNSNSGAMQQQQGGNNPFAAMMSHTMSTPIAIGVPNANQFANPQQAANPFAAMTKPAAPAPNGGMMSLASTMPTQTQPQIASNMNVQHDSSDLAFFQAPQFKLGFIPETAPPSNLA